MYIKVRNAMSSDTNLFVVSKLTKVEDLRNMIKDKMDVDPANQRLFFQGKQLEDGHTLFDYNLNVNDIIQLMVRVQPIEETSLSEDSSSSPTEKTTEEAKEKASATKNIIIKDATSDFFKVGDIVDIQDSDEGESAGAWFEGSVVRITQEEGDDIVAGCDKLTYYVKYDAYDGDDYKIKLENLRPRARKLIKSRDLQIDMEVLVNYNISVPEKRGMWFKAKVEKVRPLVCTVFAGVELTPVPGCKILFQDEVMKLEDPVRVNERSDDLDKEMNTPVERKHPEKCESCHDNDRKKCKECGCQKCGGKDQQDEQILCDECDGAYHIKCLGLKALPDEDEWFCPQCKNDDDIVKVGEKVKAGKKKAKMPSAKEGQKRDWGQGFATVGRSKECKTVDKDHFGPIPGVEVGMNWFFRMQISEEGIHRPPVGGIAGTAKLGCPSLVLSGGYEDDVDNGDEFYYTGAGGRDLSGNKRTAEQSMDQELTRTNAALALNCACPFDDKNGGEAKDWKKGKPIRVVRGYKGAKHSKYAPAEGNRYDGIYKVVKYWPEKGKAGFIVWRYLIRRDDPTPAPWTDEGKKLMEDGGYGEVRYPEGYHEALAEKAKEKAAKDAEKAKSDGTKEKRGKVSKRKVLDDVTSIVSNSKKSKIGEENAPKSRFKLSADLLKAMKEDKLNEKVWKDVIGKEYSIRKDLTEYVETQFCCIICQDVVFQPVTTPCLHNVCKPCLDRSFKAEVFTCSSCRADLGKDYEKPINSNLREALKVIFPGYEAGR